MVGFSGASHFYRYYKNHMDGDERNGEWHGKSRYYAENLPGFSSVYRVGAGAKRAQDYYDRTGQDDRYGDYYNTNALNSLVGQIASPLPGLKIPTMAKSLAKMYGAEVSLECAKFKYATQMARRYEQDRWFEYRKRQKYNDW